MYTRLYKKHGDYYQVRFLNKRTGEEIFTSFKSKKDALARAHEIDVAYHTEHPNELPKNITFDRSGSGRFRLHIWLNNNTQKHVVSSKSLEKVVEIRKYLIKQILGVL